jgi:hypothetical protein
MVDLNKVTLCLIIDQKKNFIDGNKLNNNIVNHMRRLNSFMFNIQLIIFFHDPYEIMISNTYHTTVNYTNLSKLDLMIM